MSVWLPAAIRYDIPYETFWKLNPRIMSMYQDSYIAKVKEQMQMLNYAAWLQGQYNMASIGAVMSKHGKYPKKPFEFEKKETDLSGEEKFKLWAQEFNRRFN